MLPRAIRVTAFLTLCYIINKSSMRRIGPHPLVASQPRNMTLTNQKHAQYFMRKVDKMRKKEVSYLQDTG